MFLWRVLCVWWRIGRFYGDLAGRIENHNLFRVSSFLSIMLSVLLISYQFLVMF